MYKNRNATDEVIVDFVFKLTNVWRQQFDEYEKVVDHIAHRNGLLVGLPLEKAKFVYK